MIGRLVDILRCHLRPRDIRVSPEFSYPFYEYSTLRCWMSQCWYCSVALSPTVTIEEFINGLYDSLTEHGHFLAFLRMVGLDVHLFL